VNDVITLKLAAGAFNFNVNIGLLSKCDVTFSMQRLNFSG
jgi:hypothetical protein